MLNPRPAFAVSKLLGDAVEQSLTTAHARKHLEADMELLRYTLHAMWQDTVCKPPWTVQLQERS